MLMWGVWGSLRRVVKGCMGNINMINMYTCIVGWLGSLGVLKGDTSGLEGTGRRRSTVYMLKTVDDETIVPVNLIKLTKYRNIAIVQTKTLA